MELILFICMVEAYQADGNWYPYFGQIVEAEPDLERICLVT